MRSKSFCLAEREGVGVWSVDPKQNDDSGHRVDRSTDGPSECLEENYTAGESGKELGGAGGFFELAREGDRRLASSLAWLVIACVIH